MRYEYIIGLRYLLSRRSAREPSLIGFLTVAGIALSTGVMIAVLAVMGGMEGDLRDKILGTHAHILVSGEELSVIDDPQPVLDRLAEVPGIVGISPFVQTEIMISSATNYSALILRGLPVGQERSASEMASFVIEGDLNWTNDSSKAAEYRRNFRQSEYGLTGDLEALEEQISATRREIERLRANSERGLDGDGNPLPPEILAMEEKRRLEREAQDRKEASESSVAEEKGALSEETPPIVGEDSNLMPSLPAPSDSALMPGLPAPMEQVEMPGLPSVVDEFPAPVAPNERDENLPGIVIGQELQRTLNVLVGDTVNLISPDGDLGPSGLIPRSRPYRVAGIFYSGYYLYDAGMGVVDVGSARSLLDLSPSEVTGIEIKTSDLNKATKTADSVRAALSTLGNAYEVQDWKELNRSLFAALQLERIAVSAVLTFIIVISGLLVLLVVFMFVIDKRREIAVLKAVGASRSSIMRIFFAQGLVMGLVGTVGGLILGLSFVAYCIWVGIPLPVEQYYIDRLPVVLNPYEVILVALSALLVTIGATLFPAIQASKLDPVTGLRDDQDI